MTEEEKLTNACLYAEGLDATGTDQDDPTSQDDLEDDPGDAANRCHFDQDQHFKVDTAIDQIPGYSNGELDPKTKAVLDEFPDVFQKILSNPRPELGLTGALGGGPV